MTRIVEYILMSKKLHSLVPPNIAHPQILRNHGDPAPYIDHTVAERQFPYEHQRLPQQTHSSTYITGITFTKDNNRAQNLDSRSLEHPQTHGRRPSRLIHSLSHHPLHPKPPGSTHRPNRRNPPKSRLQACRVRTSSALLHTTNSPTSQTHL